MSKFPADVSALFKPNPPLKRLEQVDYPIHERKTNPNITGLSTYLTHLTDYQSKFPQGSRNKYIESQLKIINRRRDHEIKLKANYEKWDPYNDPHMKHTDPYCTIFVGRLPYDTDELELQTIFNKFGEIDKIRIVREKDLSLGKKKTEEKKKQLKKSRGYGFIVFNNPMSSKKCIRETGVHRGIEICGRKCIVDYERGRTNKYFVPSRFGGGLGNRGYSSMDNTSGTMMPRDHRSHRESARFPPASSQNRYRGHHEGGPHHQHHYPHYPHPSSSQHYPTAASASQLLPDNEPMAEQPRVSYRSRQARTNIPSSTGNTQSLDY